MTESAQVSFKPNNLTAQDASVDEHGFEEYKNPDYSLSKEEEGWQQYLSGSTRQKSKLTEF